jgi:transcriptional regulator GlxA family with amidase domain
MQIAIALFDRFTALDAVGPFQVLVGLPDATTVFVSDRPGDVTDNTGVLALRAEATFADVPRPDIIVIPGGPGEAAHRDGGPLRDWLMAADQTSAWTTSVCTGSLILAAAGLLDGRRATTNWMAMDALAELGAKPVAERYVFDGKYATAAGVSAGIDMALALAGRIGGDDLARRLQLGIEYDPQPPYDAGSPRTAPAEIVADLLGRSRFARA